MIPRWLRGRLHTRHAGRRRFCPLRLEELETRRLLSSWQQINMLSPTGDGFGVMLLLPDGKVMINGADNINGGTNRWFELKPSASGDYAAGSYTVLQPMSQSRRFFASQVLSSNKVFVLGGEYGSKSELPTGEMYDVVANSWSPIAAFPSTNNPPQFGDGMSEVLANGTIMAGDLNSSQTQIYNPTNNTWAAGPSYFNNDTGGEETWVKLVDGSILTYAIRGTAPQRGQRFVPGSATALDAGPVPVSLTTSLNELGPAMLLPNGKVFFIGANGNTAVYTPPPPAPPNGTGSWTQGPTIPGGLGANDAPAAMLPNGHVFFAAGATPNLLGGNVNFFDFDPTANTITPVGTPWTSSNVNVFDTFMLVLPTGQVLVSAYTSLYVYSPDGGPDPAWQPVINNITSNGNNFTLTGTQLNGLSEGASYGDDAQMASNYPIVQLTDTRPTTLPLGVQFYPVYYAQTSNWSNNWVATGNKTVTTNFALPPGIPAGIYSLTAIANGISSNPVLAVIGSGGDSVTIDQDPSSPGGYVAKLNGETLSFSAGQFSQIYVFAGNGANQLYVNASPNGVPVTVFGAGSTDTVQVGNAGSVQNIQGTVNIADPGATLTVDGSADSMVAHNQMTLGTFAPASGGTWVALQGLAQGDINFALPGAKVNDEGYTVLGGKLGTGSIVLDGSTINYANVAAIQDTITATNFGYARDKVGTVTPSGASSYEVGDGPSLGGLQTETIDSDPSTTKFGTLTFANKVNMTLDGSDLPSEFILDNRSAAALLTQVTISLNATVSHLNSNGGDHGVLIATTPANVTTTVKKTNVSNTVVVAGDFIVPFFSTNNVGVQDIHGPIVLDDPFGGTILDVSDLTNTNPTNFFLNKSNIHLLAPADISYDQAVSLTLNVALGDGGNRAFVNIGDGDAASLRPTVTLNCGSGGDNVEVSAGGLSAYSFHAHGDDPSFESTGPPDTLTVTAFGTRPTVLDGQVNVGSNIVVYDDNFDQVKGLLEPELPDPLSFGDSSGGRGGQFSMYPDPVLPGVIDFSLIDSTKYLVSSFNSADVTSVLLQPIGSNNTIDLLTTPANAVTTIMPPSGGAGTAPAALGAAPLAASPPGDIINVHATIGALVIDDPNARIRIGDADHNLSAIGDLAQAGSVTVNGNGNTTVEVDDRGNSVVPPGYSLYNPLRTQFTIDQDSTQVRGQLTRVAQAVVPVFGTPTTSFFSMIVDYGGLASLTVDGGPAVAVTPTPYHVLNTAGTSAITINANGADAVTIGDADHNLSAIGNLGQAGQVTVNGNGSTTVEVDDRGNSVVPPGYSLYNPQMTRFTIDQDSTQVRGQLTRRAQAVVPIFGTPTNSFFSMIVDYGGLASLTVDGGPAVAVTPTPYHVLNTAGTSAITINANGTDAVTIGDAGHNLSVIGNLAQAGFVTVNGNGSTTVEVDDRGNSVVPPAYSLYNPLRTKFTIDQDSTQVRGQLTRVAQAIVPVFGTPTTSFFSMIVDYGGLASLTVDGGPAVAVTPTPYEVLNTAGIISPPGTAAVTINAHGTDAVVIGDANNTINGIKGAVSIIGNGLTTLNIRDDGTSSTQAYQLFATQLLRYPNGQALGNPTQTINYFNINHVYVHGGTASDAWYANSTLAGTSTDLISGNGLPAGLVSVWKGDGDANDFLSGNNGTLQPGVTFAPGVTGATGDQAFSFNGSNGLVDLGQDPSLNISGSLTVSAWVNVQSLNHYKYLFADFDPTGHLSQGSLGILATGQFFWFQGNEGITNGSVEPFGATHVNLNQWYHVAVVRDDNAKTVTLYVNGIQDGSVSYAGIPVLTLQGDKLLGGSGPGFLRDSFSGLLDEVALFNRALSAAEIQNIYNSRAFGGDTVNIGSSANTLDPIQGAITVNGQGNTTLNFNDLSGNPAAGYDYELSQNSFSRTGTATTTFSGIATLNLHAANKNVNGPGENQLSVGSTAPGTTYNVYGGTGFNQFVVGETLNGIQGALFLHGSGTGFTAVSIYDIFDQSPQAFLLTAGPTSQSGMVQRFDAVSNQADMAAINYDGITGGGSAALETANAYSSAGLNGDTVHVQSNAADLWTRVLVGTGDTVTVGNPAHTMTGIGGDLRIQEALAPEKPAVILDDAGDTTSRSIDLANDGANGYRITGLLSTSSPGRGNVWLLFSLAAPVSLKTGTGDDVFRVHDFTGAPAVSLVAEPATSTRTNQHNKLDYSAYTGTVEVVLTLGQATGFARVSGIQDVAAGIGNSLLVGDAGPNILTGGTGRNVLIGGGGGDTLDAHLSTGDNLLIAGTTSYDGTPNYRADLDAIFAEWTRTDLPTVNSFQIRYNDLLFGTGSTNPQNKVNGQLILLTPATNKTSSNGAVHADSTPDTLIGSNGIDPTTGKRVHNWFFDDSDDMIVNFMKPYDHENKVT
jgi:hypothetical protein